MPQENEKKKSSKFKSRTFWWGVGISIITLAGMITGKVNWMEGITVMSGVYGAFKLADTWEKVKNNKKESEVK